MSSRFDAYKNPMDDVTIFVRFQVNLIVAQSGNAVGWMRAICQYKCNGVVKVDHFLVLNVSNLGAIIYVVLAKPTVHCDQVWVLFTKRGKDLHFDSDSQDAFHLR
jgi:hypothetical protein